MSTEQKIDLKQRLKNTDTKLLNGLVSFTAGELSENNLNELALISELLDRVGISLEVTRKINKETKFAYDFIVLKVNEEKYQSVKTRHAGRKADFERKYDAYGKCTVDELKEKLKTRKKTEIAAELGCSRMTLYRIIRNINEREPAGDTSIWHYTS